MSATAMPRRRPGRPAQDPAQATVIILLWLLLALFVVYPLIELLGTAFSGGKGYSLGPLVAALGNAHYLKAFRNSLLLAFLVGILGTATGFLFAYTVERAGLGRTGRKIFGLVTLLPLISPPFTTSIAFVFSSGRRA